MPDLMELSELCATVLNEARFPHNRPAYEPPETGPNVPDEIVAFIHELKDTMDDYVKVFIDDLASVGESNGATVRHAVDLYEDINENAINVVERFAGSRETVRIQDTERPDRIMPYRNPEWRASEKDLETAKRLGIDPGLIQPGRWYRQKDEKGNFGPWNNIEFYLGKTDDRGRSLEDPAEARGKLWDKLREDERAGRAETAEFKGRMPERSVPDTETGLPTYGSDVKLPGGRWKTVTEDPEAGLDKTKQNFDEDSDYKKHVRDVMFSSINRFFPELHKNFFEFYDFLKTKVVPVQEDPKTDPSNDLVVDIVDRSIDLQKVVDAADAGLPALGRSELGIPEPMSPETLEQDEENAPGTDEDDEAKARDVTDQLRASYSQEREKMSRDEAERKNEELRQYYAQSGETPDPADFVAPEDVYPGRHGHYTHVPTKQETETRRNEAEKQAEAEETRDKWVEQDKREWTDRIKNKRRSEDRPRWNKSGRPAMLRFPKTNPGPGERIVGQSG